MRVLAKNKGVESPVILAALKFSKLPNGTCITDLDDSGNSPCWDSLAELQELKKTLPIVHRLTLDIFPARVFGTMAVIHHELGHAKFHEDYPEKNSYLNEYRGFSSLWEVFHERHFKAHYKDLVAEEQFADAAIPDEQPLLKAARDVHAMVAQELEFPEVGLSGMRIDFAVPMSEFLANICDKLRYGWLQGHPSSFRRAHDFDARLKALKAEKVSQ